MRMQSGKPRPCSDRLGYFPDALTRDPTLDALAGSVLVRNHKERCRGWQPGSLGGHIITQDGSSRSRQGHRHLVTTLAHDPSKPEVRGDISYVQRRHFTATKPAIGHGGEDRALPETTLL
jgi:hypothetical protein